MNSLIVYYAHYGNTAVAAARVLDNMAKYGKADTAEIEYSGYKKSLIQRTFFRLFPNFVRLNNPPLGLLKYYVLCIGIPVWGGRPSAPITKYLTMLKDLRGKKILCFYVYSIEASARKCSRFVENILKKRGNPQVNHILVPWQKVHDNQFLDQLITATVAKPT